MILNNYNDYLTYGGNEYEKRISTSFDSNFSTFNDCLWWRKGAGTQKSEKGDGMTYAVEAGSAGEAVAKEKGFNYNSVSSQADALMEVKSGTSDAAIIDLLMAGAMIGEGTSYPDLVHTTELTSEKYGVGCRKGSDLASYINSVFAESYADGSAQEIAKKYGVQDSLLEQEPCEFKQSDSDSDVDYIKWTGQDDCRYHRV